MVFWFTALSLADLDTAFVVFESAWIDSDWARYHGHSVFKFDFVSVISTSIMQYYGASAGAPP